MSNLVSPKRLALLPCTGQHRPAVRIVLRFERKSSMISISTEQRQIIEGAITGVMLTIVGCGFWLTIKLPKLMPRVTRAQVKSLGVWMHGSVVVLAVLLIFVYRGLDRITRPASPRDAPQEAAAANPERPRLHFTSAVRGGDEIKIVCGISSMCAVSASRHDAAENTKNGTVYQIKNGTKAGVIFYDPVVSGADIAAIYIEAGPYAEQSGWVPAKWMHRLPK